MQFPNAWFVFFQMVILLALELIFVWLTLVLSEVWLYKCWYQLCVCVWICVLWVYLRLAVTVCLYVCLHMLVSCICLFVCLCFAGECCVFVLCSNGIQPLWICWQPGWLSAWNNSFMSINSKSSSGLWRYFFLTYMEVLMLWSCSGMIVVR